MKSQTYHEALEAEYQLHQVETADALAWARERQERADDALLNALYGRKAAEMLAERG